MENKKDSNRKPNKRDKRGTNYRRNKPRVQNEPSNLENIAQATTPDFASMASTYAGAMLQGVMSRPNDILRNNKAKGSNALNGIVPSVVEYVFMNDTQGFMENTDAASAFNATLFAQLRQSLKSNLTYNDSEVRNAILGAWNVRLYLCMLDKRIAAWNAYSEKYPTMNRALQGYGGTGSMPSGEIMSTSPYLVFNPMTDARVATTMQKYPRILALANNIYIPASLAAETYSCFGSFFRESDRGFAQLYHNDVNHVLFFSLNETDQAVWTDTVSTSITLDDIEQQIGLLLSRYATIYADLYKSIDVVPITINLGSEKMNVYDEQSDYARFMFTNYINAYGTNVEKLLNADNLLRIDYLAQDDVSKFCPYAYTPIGAETYSQVWVPYYIQTCCLMFWNISSADVNVPGGSSSTMVIDANSGAVSKFDVTTLSVFDGAGAGSASDLGAFTVEFIRSVVDYCPPVTVQIRPDSTAGNQSTTYLKRYHVGTTVAPAALDPITYVYWAQVLSTNLNVEYV